MSDTLIAGRYRLDEVLGRGGMSEVWVADDLELGRRVAIKLLAPNADTARFEREARAFASLGHPNVTQLFDYGEEEHGRPYMVLEYLPGGTLEDRLRDARPLPDDETRAIATGIAAGLAHAHARGVVHRDLKPSNVLFDEEGRPKLADFGIARLTSGEGTLTEAGTVLGTAAYISPEQAEGLPATAASDVYSFGVILYRMLTGRLPFEAADPMALVVKHRDEEPPPVSSLRRDAPAALEATATAALAKDPRRRPQDGAALLAELGAPAGASAGTATAATFPLDDETRVLARPAAAPQGPGGPPGAAPRRSMLPFVVVGLLVLALAGAIVAYAVTRSPSAPGDTGTFTPITLPSGSTTTGPSTTAQTTTAPTTTAPTTTAQTTTAQTTAPTTAATTAAPPPTTAQTTTAPPTTTAVPPTTDTVAPTTDTTTVP